MAATGHREVRVKISLELRPHQDGVFYFGPGDGRVPGQRLPQGNDIRGGLE